MVILIPNWPSMFLICFTDIILCFLGSDVLRCSKRARNYDRMTMTRGGIGTYPRTAVWEETSAEARTRGGLDGLDLGGAISRVVKGDWEARSFIFQSHALICIFILED